MRPSLILQQYSIAIRELALRHKVRNVRVFGSVVRGEDIENSDLDLLVEPTADTTLMDIAAFELEIETLLGVAVDVQTPNALPAKFRENVLADAKPL